MISPEEFASTFQSFMRQMSVKDKPEEPAFRRKISDHFGSDPAGFPVVGENFEQHDHANLHLAIEAFLADQGRTADVLGIASENKLHMGISLAQLVSPASRGIWVQGRAVPGPVEYENIPLHDDHIVACVKSGLFLVREGDTRLAILVDNARSLGPHARLKVEIMAPHRPLAESVLAALRTLMRARDVYRGRVISLETNEVHALQVRFHRLPAIRRENIILPEGLLDRIERQTLRFTHHGRRLRAAGRHLKRGILLHGPPGTGKTLTAMYVSGAITERTVLLVTGPGQGLIKSCCRMARMLQPAIVIVEDVDLIAKERTSPSCSTPLLFELLNQMDGLADDADVLFLLTTNRPELLEPALASRPGRVDQAIEIPRPDDACRQRLFDLYGKGLTIHLTNRTDLIKRTDGASAAFIRELFRKAALFAADEAPGESIEVADRHFEHAMHELVLNGPLTKRILGFAPDPGSS